MDAQFGRVIVAGDGELDFDGRRVVGNFTGNGYPIEAVTTEFAFMHYPACKVLIDQALQNSVFGLGGWFEVSPILFGTNAVNQGGACCAVGDDLIQICKLDGNLAAKWVLELDS